MWVLTKFCQGKARLSCALLAICLLVGWYVSATGRNLYPAGRPIDLTSGRKPKPSDYNDDKDDDNNGHNNQNGPPQTLSTHVPFAPGTPKLAGQNYTRTLVIAKMQEDDTTWVDSLVDSDPNLTSAVYVVDNATAELTVPKNKGHEVMVYLTYVIDHYHALDDITLFMHSHLFTWHNNDFLDSSSAQIVQRLRSERVVREGYVNLRCHHQPGCPDHIHPTLDDNDHDDLLNIPEAAIIGNSWVKLFPGQSLPEVLSQPCCGQFAVSADRIRQIPLEKFSFYRDWVLGTKLEDRLSGRVWEYVWQYLFAGMATLCPEEHVCYCEGYGICFDKQKYEHYFELRDEARGLEKEVEDMKSANPPDPMADDKITTMKDRIFAMRQEMDAIKAKAAQ